LLEFSQYSCIINIDYGCLEEKRSVLDAHVIHVIHFMTAIDDVVFFFCLYNIITHACFPDEYVPQILNADITGQKLYEDYGFLCDS